MHEKRKYSIIYYFKVFEADKIYLIYVTAHYVTVACQINLT